MAGGVECGSQHRGDQVCEHGSKHLVVCFSGNESQHTMWQCPQCEREFRNTNQNHRCGEPPKTIEAYIAAQPEDVQPILNELHSTIKGALPESRESISWSMPTYWGRSEHLIQFAAYKKHIGLFVGDMAIAHFVERLGAYQTSQHGIQLPFARPLPHDVIADIARWRSDAEEA